jgi:hypothetical protein
VAHLTPAALRAELDLADLYTLAECLDLPDGEEAAVDAMRPFLRVEGDPDPEFVYAEVHWKKEGRPIQIERVADPKRVREEVDETIENWLTSQEPGPRRVAEHLRSVCEVVDLEMGIGDSLHLGATLAEVIAFRIAEEGDGLVWFYHRDWASPDDRGVTLFTTA